MEQIKDRLKELRKRLGLKQRDVAERLEVSVGLIGAWECGSDTIPKTRIYQLCNEYNVSRDWLERGDGEMFVPVEESESDFIEVMRSMYNALPPNYQEVWIELAETIMRDRPSEREQKLRQACDKMFVNNGVNNGTQRID